MFPEEFNPSIYRKKNIDLIWMTNKKLEEHSQRYGKQEGRICSLVRDPESFIELCDLRNSLAVLCNIAENG
ncbi:MAG: hypothetical protein U9R19_06330 [Bacteroidota bacterium]|nr:hypothetical protein [Bacteroidota bacterium]